jgi:hypothetical protein
LLSPFSLLTRENGKLRKKLKRESRKMTEFQKAATGQIEEIARKMREENAELSVEVARLRGREADLITQLDESRVLTVRMGALVTRLAKKGVQMGGEGETLKSDIEKTISG